MRSFPSILLRDSPCKTPWSSIALGLDSTSTANGLIADMKAYVKNCVQVASKLRPNQCLLVTCLAESTKDAVY